MNEDKTEKEKRENKSSSEFDRLRRSTLRRLWRFRLGNALLHPTVITAVVTTIVGSLAVGVLTNYVTKSLGERELKIKVVSALMKHTQDADFHEESEILKLDALTKLIEENQDLEVKVSGFRAIVSNFAQDKLAEATQEVERLSEDLLSSETTKAELGKRLAELETRKKTASRNEQKQLEDDIAVTRSQLQEAQGSYASLRQQHKQAVSKAQSFREQLGEERIRLQKSQERVAVLETEKLALQSKITELERKHIVAFLFTTSEASSDTIRLVFSNRSTKELTDEVELQEAREFLFLSPSEDRLELYREVRDVSFLKLRYFRIVNQGTNGWSGTISLSVDGERKFICAAEEKKSKRTTQYRSGNLRPS